MSRRRWFLAASWVALAGWVGALVWSVLVALAGVSGAAGWTAYQLPGVDSIGVRPSWNVSAGAAIESPGDPMARSDGRTTTFRLVRDSESGGSLRNAEVQPSKISLGGPADLVAGPGWSGLMVSLFAMAALGGLVLSWLLYLLWRILRAAGSGGPFTLEVVRRVRLIGVVYLGWQVAQPLLWLFLSPKAWDIGAESRGPLAFDLGDQEPGGPTLVGVGFAVLLVLLAEVLRYGADIEDERSLTV